MSFGKARVLAFESRRAVEMAELIRINGGEPFVAPALQEVPLSHNEQAFHFADRLYAGGFEMIIFLTGVGALLLDRALATRDAELRFRDALRSLAVVVRGPKPSAVMREWHVPVTVSVPEPNTWRELLTAVKGRPEVSVALQEYGRRNEDLVSGLAAQGRRVTPVPVYQWQLPADTAPLARALDGLLDGEYQVSLFTTATQLDHLVQFAEIHGKREAVLEALRQTYIASIGPTCSEALHEHGLVPMIEPGHPKMGILVREAALAYATRLK